MNQIYHIPKPLSRILNENLTAKCYAQKMSFSPTATWIIVVVVVIIGYIAYVAYPIYKAIHQTKYLMAEAVPYQQDPPNAKFSILMAGDSTAVGTGAATPAGSTAGLIGAEYPDASISNIGVNGLKLDGLLQKFQEMPTTTQYDLIVIQIGANDIVGFTPLSKVSSELSQGLVLARQHAKHVVVLTAGDVGLAPVFRFPLSYIFEQRTLAVRKIFMSEIAQYQNVSYVDLFKYRNDEIFNTDIPKYYAADHFHPSAAGYAVWYQSIKPQIQRVAS